MMGICARDAEQHRDDVQGDLARHLSILADRDWHECHGVVPADIDDLGIGGISGGRKLTECLLRDPGCSPTYSRTAPIIREGWR